MNYHVFSKYIESLLSHYVVAENSSSLTLHDDDGEELLLLTEEGLIDVNDTDTVYNTWRRIWSTIEGTYSESTNLVLLQYSCKEPELFLRTEYTVHSTKLPIVKVFDKFSSDMNSLLYRSKNRVTLQSLDEEDENGVTMIGSLVIGDNEIYDEFTPKEVSELTSQIPITYQQIITDSVESVLHIRDISKNGCTISIEKSNRYSF